MDERRWQAIKEVVGTALDLPPGERSRYLDEACGDDPDLRSEVEALLGVDSAAIGFLDHPPLSLGAADTPALEGQSIGAYRIVCEIGRGGMGVVYLAARTDGAFERQDAIKVLRARILDARLEERFRREIRVLARLEHPHIARLYEGGQTADGRPFFVMERIHGRWITDHCESQHLSLADRLALFRAVCLAVQNAHASFVVHCDLKPSNILVTEQGEPKLVDFGIAKVLSEEYDAGGALTAGLDRPATPDYASPEQLVLGGRITVASDVFSLGVVFYEVLTGHHPFHLAGRNQPAVRPSDVVAHRLVGGGGGPPLTAEARTMRRLLRGDLDRIVLKAMEKEPEHRYHSVEELLRDLDLHRQGLPLAHARTGGTLYRTRKLLRRRWPAISAAALVVATILAFGISEWRQSKRLAYALAATRQEKAKVERISQLLVGLFEVSDPEIARGRSPTAREILDRGADRLRRELGDQPDVRASLLHTMGVVYGKLGAFEQAQPLLEEALSIRRRTTGSESLAVAESIGELAIVLRQRSKFDAAEAAYRESLRLHRKLLGPGDRRVATAGNNLAVALIEMRNDTAAAEPLVREALAIRRRLYPANHGAVAESLMTLAELHRIRGEDRVAEPLYREALQVSRALYRGDHPTTADALHNFAVSLIAQKRYGEAEDRLREALPMRRRLLGPEHHKTADTLNELALVLQEQGEYAEAEALMREVLRIRTKTLGRRHQDVAISLMSISVLCQDLGRYGEAEALSRQALALWRELLGDEHPTVATSLENLGVLLMLQGKYDEAEPLYLETLAMRRRLLGEKHPDVAATLHGLAALAFRSGRFQDAERYAKAAVALRREVLAADNPLLGVSLTGLSNAIAAQQRFVEAEAVAREAVGVMSRAYPKGHWTLDAAEGALGSSLVGQRRFLEAEPILLGSYRHTAAVLGAKSPQADKAGGRVLRLYEAWGKGEKATAFRSEHQIGGAKP